MLGYDIKLFRMIYSMFGYLTSHTISDYTENDFLIILKYEASKHDIYHKSVILQFYFAN